MRRRGRGCLLKSRRGQGSEATNFESYVYGTLRYSALNVVVQVSEAKAPLTRVVPLVSLQCTLHFGHYRSCPNLCARLLIILERPNRGLVVRR